MSAETTILAIETSCDETGVAILTQKGDKITVLAERIASQIDVHKTTGGVVPEIAAREHVTIIRPLIEQVLSESGVNKEELDAIAVTVGPGLQPALSVGVAAAQGLSFALKIPIIPVHHLEGHIYSALLQGEPVFPALALLVSGGHTMLVKINDHLNYEIIGSTRDDAVGEAFDKVARLLGLTYPGGPAISKLAQEGDESAFKFSRPMQHSGDLDFSFSGLKTDVLYTIRDLTKDNKEYSRADIAASFQAAAIDSLLIKTAKAIKDMSPKVVLLAGGVAANQKLREDLTALAERENVELRIAPLDLCGDNATMIGQAGLQAFKSKRVVDYLSVDAKAKINLETFK